MLSLRETRILVLANQVLVNQEREVAVGRQAARVQALLGRNKSEKGIWTVTCELGESKECARGTFAD